MKKNWWKIAGLVALFLAPMILGGCLNEGSKPRAYIGASTISGEAPLTVTFRGSSDQKVDVYQWTFGDGASGYGQSVVHVYQSSGDYIVTLVVSKTNCCGASMSDPTKITIKVLPAQIPAVQLIYVSPLPACQNQPISLSAEIANGPITQWRWRTSDGQTSLSPSPIFVFSTMGKKAVWLKVANAKGHWSNEAQTDFNVQNCCQICPPTPSPQPPCPSCYLEGLDPEKACISAYKAFTISAKLSGWPCDEYNTCDAKAENSAQGIVPGPAPDCGYCEASITWSFFYYGQRAKIGEDYQVIYLDGQFDQVVTVKFLRAGEWSAKATLASSSGTESVWGYYVVKVQ